MPSSQASKRARSSQGKGKGSKTGRSNDNNFSPESQELHPARPHYEGDLNTKWTHGQVVWAKSKDFPWWTGTIDLINSDSSDDSNSNSNSNSNNKNKSKSKNKSKKKSKKSSGITSENGTIRVKWFGDFGSEHAYCKLKNVIAFDASKKDEIIVEVQSCDEDQFIQCCHEAEKVDSEMKEELGFIPKKNSKSKSKNKTKKTVKSKGKKPTNESNSIDTSDNDDEDEEEQDIDVQDIDNVDNSSNRNGRKHNRPSYKSGKNKETNPAPPTSPTLRRSKRLSVSQKQLSQKSNNNNNDDSNSNNNSSKNENENAGNSVSAPRRSARLREHGLSPSKSELTPKSGRKRKLTESTIDNAVNSNSGRNVRQKRAHSSQNSNNINNSNDVIEDISTYANNSNNNNNNKSKNKTKSKSKTKSKLTNNSNNSNNDNNDNNNNDNSDTSNGGSLRRSARLNMQNYQALNGLGIQTTENHIEHWQSSLDMILDVNSAEDLTPFVGLVLHGLMRNSKLSYHNALKYCCDIWDFDLNALDAHMDFFYQDEKKFKRKQKFGNGPK